MNIRSNLHAATTAILFAWAASTAALAQPQIDPAYEWPPIPPQMEYDAPADRVEAWRQDIYHFRPYLYLNRSYAIGARLEAEARLLALEANLGEASDVAFVAELFRIAALGDNAHSNVRERGFVDLFGSVPIRGYLFADGFHVLRADAANADLLGARLVAVEGRPLPDVLAAVRDLVGGPDVYFENVTPDLLFTVPALLHHLAIAESPDALTMTFEDASGATFDRRIAATPADGENPGEKAWVNLFPSAAPEDSSWSLAVAEAGVAPALRDWSRPYFVERLEGDAILMTIRNMRDVDGRSLEAFLNEVSGALAHDPGAALIVDLRFAFGGDFTLTEPFFSGLAETLPAESRAYVLTGRSTFSAGVLAAAVIKQALGARAVFVGDGVGDRLRFWAEAPSYRLPNSQLRPKYSLQLHDVADGCTDRAICWPDNDAPIAVGDLEPDVRAPLTFADYRVGRDAALEAALAAIGAD